jgi:hypothetical protein
LNGYYHWVSGTAYTKDADLVGGVIESGNADAVSGGAVFDAISDGSTVETIETVTGTKDITGDLIVGSYYNNSGITHNRGGTQRTALIPIKQYNVIHVKTFSNISLFICFFDENQVFISSIPDTNGVLELMTLPVNTAFIAASGDTGSEIVIENRLITYESILSSSGDSASAISLATSVNNNLISDGYNDVNVIGADNFLPSSYYSSSGTLQNHSIFSATPLIAIVASSVMSGNFMDDGGGSASTVCYFDVNRDFISFRNGEAVNEILSIPTNAVFMSLTQKTVDIGSVDVKIVGHRRAKIDGFDNTAIQEQFESVALNENIHNRYSDLGSQWGKRKEVVGQANHGVLMMGQSNMVGTIPYDEITALNLPTTTTRTQAWDGNSFNLFSLTADNNWGIWWSILYRLDNYLTNETINYYQRAGGGTTLHGNWDADTDNGNAMANQAATEILQIKETLPTVNFKSFVWIQGESDKVAPYNADYYENLKNFIAFMRGVVGNPRLHFSIVGMHKDQGHYSQIVRNNQVKVCNQDAYATFINPDSLTFSSLDGLHYNGVYAEALAPLIFNDIKDL